MPRTSSQGWRSFSFMFGAFDQMNAKQQNEDQEQREITDRLLRHIDEIACGGWSSRHPSLDEIDKL